MRVIEKLDPNLIRPWGRAVAQVGGEYAVAPGAPPDEVARECRAEGVRALTLRESNPAYHAP